MIRDIVTVSSGTLVSRLLGFGRDAMVAALLGAGPVADAFLVAFQMVNVVRRLLTEGALNAALVPAWLRVRDENGNDAAAKFAGRVLGTLGVIVVAVALLSGVAAPVLMVLLAPGFAEEATRQLAVDDLRLMLPYLAFAGPVAVLMALQNAQHRFTLTAFSPVLFNLALIGVMAMLMLQSVGSAAAALAIAAAVGVAGLLQLTMLALPGRGGAIATPLGISFDPQMRRLFGRAVPGMIAGAGPQMLIVAGAIVASQSPATVSWLYFANRLIELPLGIVGSAMGLVLVPELTRARRGGDADASRHAESRSLELAVGLTLPATLGLIVLAEPIVRLLFEHGAFTATDSRATAQALTMLALGLPAHVLTKILSPAFFARDDTMTPMVATLGGLAVAIAAALALAPRFGAVGIAAAIALAAWSGALLLAWRGAGAFGFSIDAEARRRLPRIGLAALSMGVLLWLTAGGVWPPGADAHGLAQAGVLGLLIAVGLMSYGGLLVLFGVLNPAAIRSRLRR